MITVRILMPRNIAFPSLIVAVALTSTQLACRRPSGTDVIAEYRGGRVLGRASTQQLRGMPAARRAAFAIAGLETWQALVREMVMNRLRRRGPNSTTSPRSSGFVNAPRTTEATPSTSVERIAG